MAEQICIHAFVSGRVQGVYFRVATQETAQSMGLTGWVRNLIDGRVEVVACGTKDAVDDFERWLWQGPSAAHVEDVRCQVVTEPDTLEIGEGFEVRPTG